MNTTVSRPISPEAASAYLVAVLRVPCSPHNAPSGEHCWTQPRAVCGDRIARGGRLRVRGSR